MVTADEVTVERIRKLVTYLDTPLEQSGNVRVVYLEYADSVEVAEVLTRVMQNIARLEEGGANKRSGNNESTIEADAGTNSLIITADTDEMAALESEWHGAEMRRLGHYRSDFQWPRMGKIWCWSSPGELTGLRRGRGSRLG